jgi:hypothetical protein
LVARRSLFAVRFRNTLLEPSIFIVVILSEAKDLLSHALKRKQVLRFAQDDNRKNKLLSAKSQELTAKSFFP